MLSLSAPAAISSQISLSNQSAAPGSSILFPVTFVSEGASISGIQFDLEYDGSTMSFATTLGDALRQSGKNMYSADLASNRKRILIVGTNQSQISDGTLFNLFVNVSATASQGSYPLKIAAVVGTDPNGVPVAVLGLAGTLTVSASATITRLQVNGVLNAASWAADPVAPGEIITLIGSGIGPLTPRTPTSPSATVLAGTSVLFDGVPAPLLYVAPNQINAVVPYEIYAKANTELKITLEQQTVAATSLTVGGAAPALFTVDSSGVGQGAILNQDLTINSPTKPAEKGSFVTLFATGAGQTDPPGQDGQLAGAVLPKPLLPVAVQIGGLDAEVQYAGAAPGLISGLLQVNAKIPETAPSGAAIPIELIIGQISSPAGVTLAIK
jgi:uncharacterized protein (TIGR03437 family)